MNIRLYFACASLLALTLPALAAPELAPSAAGASHGPDAGIVLAQGGGPPPHAQGGGKVKVEEVTAAARV